MIPGFPRPELPEQGAGLLPQDTLPTPHSVECCHWPVEAPLLVWLYLYFLCLFSSATDAYPKKDKHSKFLMHLLCLYVSLQNVFCVHILTLLRGAWMFLSFPTQHFALSCSTWPGVHLGRGLTGHSPPLP